MVAEQSAMFETMDYFIDRTQPYNPSGRNQTEQEASEVAVQLWDMLARVGIEPKRLPGEKGTSEIIVDDIMFKLRK